MGLKGKKHKIGCGPSYGRIEWMQSLPGDEIAVARGGWMLGQRAHHLSKSAAIVDIRAPLDPASCVGGLFSWRHSQSLRRMQDANTACSSKFYDDIFKASGKLPQHPNYRAMNKLVRDLRFTGGHGTSGGVGGEEELCVVSCEL